MKKLSYIIIGIAVVMGLVFGAFVAWRQTSLYIHTPDNIRKPEFAHHHFRLQMFYGDEKIDFSEAQFQETYEQGMCSSDLADTPIHFHDDMDQIVHIHWNNITGGQVLKYYGLNLSDKPANILGYQPGDNFFNLNKVEIKGDYLKDRNWDEEFFVYSGDENSYERRSIEEFSDQDLEQFFGVQSSQSERSAFNLWKLFSTSVEAHNNNGLAQSQSVEILPSSEVLETQIDSGGSDRSQEELEKINDLIGNVVIFVAPKGEEPNEDRIQAAFNNLTPLMDSVCGG